MATLDALLEKQQALQAQIDRVKREARDSVLEEIRKLMADHGLTAADLSSARASSKPSARAGAKMAAKYRHPESGASWSGRGLKPKWLTDELSKGHALADFAV